MSSLQPTVGDAKRSYRDPPAQMDEANALRAKNQALQKQVDQFNADRFAVPRNTRCHSLAPGFAVNRWTVASTRFGGSCSRPKRR